MRVPPGVTLAPQDFDELTIDYPALPYRAWAERHAALVAYWRLDEAAVTLAADSEGNTPLTYTNVPDLQYRAFRQETSAVPYGGAPQWTHTSGAGLSGTLPTGIDPTFTMAGFVRIDGSAGDGSRYVWYGGQNTRALRATVLGTALSFSLRLDGRTINAPGFSLDTWHHVAVVRTAARLGLWVDGVDVGNAVPGTVTTLDGRAWQMALAISNAAVDLALDEWGHLVGGDRRGRALRPSDPPPGLRRLRLRRGGCDRPVGPADQHVLSLSLAGLRPAGWITATCGIFTRAPSGSTIREIVQDVLDRAGLDDVFTLARR